MGKNRPSSNDKTIPDSCRLLFSRICSGEDKEATFMTKLMAVVCYSNRSRNSARRSEKSTVSFYLINLYKQKTAEKTCGIRNETDDQFHKLSAMQ